MGSSSFPTRFDSTLDLARLPWFEVVGGNRLVLSADAADEVGPVLDMHTHLAMGFFRKLRVDLHAETPTVAHYLPVTLPVDLDRSSNENFDRASIFQTNAALSVLALTAHGITNPPPPPNLLPHISATRTPPPSILPAAPPLPAVPEGCGRWLCHAIRAG